ncbi:MAG: ATP-binding cassette domain-containing protein [Gammaproteobacteria bacterium]
MVERGPEAMNRNSDVKPAIASVDALPEAIDERLVIRVGGMKVGYGASYVLENVNLEVRKGEFISIVGKSGSGKSTLLYGLAGFIPTAGDVHVPDNIGMVFQNYACFPG